MNITSPSRAMQPAKVKQHLLTPLRSFLKNRSGFSRFKYSLLSVFNKDRFDKECPKVYFLHIMAVFCTDVLTAIPGLKPGYRRGVNYVWKKTGRYSGSQGH